MTRSREANAAADKLEGLVIDLETAEGGLEPALKTLARRSAIPVELDVRVDGRQAASVEAAATTSSPRH